MPQTQVLGDRTQKRRYDPSLAASLNSETLFSKSTLPTTNQVPVPASFTPLDTKLENYYPLCPVVPDTNESVDLTNFVLLPGVKSGVFGYEPRLVSMVRDNHNYTWEDAHQALARKNRKMLTTRQYVDFLGLIRDGSEGKMKVLNGNGDEISQERLAYIRDVIFSKKESRESTWLDGVLSQSNGHLILAQGHHIVQGKLVAQRGHSLELDECLKRDYSHCLDINSWIDHHTPLGFPHANMESSDKRAYDNIDRKKHPQFNLIYAAPNFLKFGCPVSFEDSTVRTVYEGCKRPTKYHMVKLGFGTFFYDDDFNETSRADEKTSTKGLRYSYSIVPQGVL